MQLPLGKKKIKASLFCKKKKMLTTSVTLGRFSSLRGITPNFFPFNKILSLIKIKNFLTALSISK